jgi:hypothetical protein
MMPTMERPGIFLNAKEEAVHTHSGECGLLRRRPGQKRGGRPHLLYDDSSNNFGDDC